MPQTLLGPHQPCYLRPFTRDLHCCQDTGQSEVIRDTPAASAHLPDFLNSRRCAICVICSRAVHMQGKVRLVVSKEFTLEQIRQVDRSPLPA